MTEPPLSDQIKYTFSAILLSFIIVSINRLITNEDPKLNNHESSNFKNLLIVLIIYVVLSKSN
jgi:hypothetical protein